MKIISLLLLTALCVSRGMGEPATQLVRVDSPRIQALAMKAILAKHTSFKTNDLVYTGLMYSLPANSEEQINVTYNLTNSVKANTNGGWVTTKMKTYTVTLSNSGETIYVSEGLSTSNSTIKK